MGIDKRILRPDAIGLTVVVVALAVYLLVIHRGQSASLNDVAARTAACRRRIEADTAKAAPVPQMARDVARMRQRYNKDWDRRLPRRQELAGFLREISAHLSEQKLANQMIQPGRPEPGPLYNRLPITMRFEGGFPALASFLQRVDAMTRLTRVEQLRIATREDDAQLAIELGMNIYFTEQ